MLKCQTRQFNTFLDLLMSSPNASVSLHVTDEMKFKNENVIVAFNNFIPNCQHEITSMIILWCKLQEDNRKKEYIFVAIIEFI